MSKITALSFLLMKTIFLLTFFLIFILYFYYWLFLYFLKENVLQTSCICLKSKNKSCYFVHRALLHSICTSWFYGEERSGGRSLRYNQSITYSHMITNTMSINDLYCLSNIAIRILIQRGRSSAHFINSITPVTQQEGACHAIYRLCYTCMRWKSNIIHTSSARTERQRTFFRP